MKNIFVILLLAFTMNAQAIPSVSNIKLYKSRMNLYISMGQTPEQVVQSLRNYYGKSYFMLKSNGWEQTYDIVIIEGENAGITYFETLGTVPME